MELKLWLGLIEPVRALVYAVLLVVMTPIAAYLTVKLIRRNKGGLKSFKKKHPEYTELLLCQKNNDQVFYIILYSVNGELPCFKKGLLENSGVVLIPLGEVTVAAEFEDARRHANRARGLRFGRKSLLEINEQTPANAAAAPKVTFTAKAGGKYRLTVDPFENKLLLIGEVGEEHFTLKF